MIILSESTTGKTTLAKRLPQVVDLESYLFYKVNDNEIDYDLWVRHLFEAGIYRNFIACSHHYKELRKLLIEKKIPYILVIPEKDLKDEYYDRIMKRGSSVELANSFKEHWYESQEVFKNENVFYLPSNKYLIDVLPQLEIMWNEITDKQEIHNMIVKFKKELDIL